MEHLHHNHPLKQFLRLFHYLYVKLLIVTSSYSRECPIIPVKIATYYSQNYAGMLGSGLIAIAFQKDFIVDVYKYKLAKS